MLPAMHAASASVTSAAAVAAPLVRAPTVVRGDWISWPRGLWIS